MAIYLALSEPLKQFYAERGILKVVGFQPTLEATTQAVLDALGI